MTKEELWIGKNKDKTFSEQNIGCVDNHYRKTTFNGKKIYLHRIIWTLTNGAIPDGFIVHHKDGNGLNNEINNLELMTKEKHTSLHTSGHSSWISGKRGIGTPMFGRTGEKNPMFGVRRYGDNSPRHKLTQEQINKIRKLYATGNFKQQTLANMFKISRPQISSIVNFKTWKEE